jgi:hypothetical protein
MMVGLVEARAGRAISAGPLLSSSLVVAVAKDAITGIINVVQDRRPMSWSTPRRPPIRPFELEEQG